MKEWLYRIQDRFAAIWHLYVAVFRYVIAVLLAGAHVSLRSELHWPVFGQALSLLGFVELFITAGGFLLIYLNEQALTQQTGECQSCFAVYLIGGFGQNHHVAIFFRAAR